MSRYWMRSCSFFANQNFPPFTFDVLHSAAFTSSVKVKQEKFSLEKKFHIWAAFGVAYVHLLFIVSCK